MDRIRIRKSALLAGSALMLVLSGSSGAWAQCTGAAAFGGGALPALDFSALASGAAASVNSLVSVLNTANTAFLTQSNALIGSPPDPAPNQQGGGVWARGIGGRVDTESVGVVSFAPNAFWGIPPGTSITCNTKTRTDFGGYQAGMDIARLNVGGINLHVGGTVGYVEANAKDISPPPPGASFTGNFQIPFVGFYAALTQGGFFLDAQVRADFYEMSLNDPTNGLFNQSLEAKGTTFSSNVGYNLPLGSWFIEPSAGVVWSRVNVDPLNVSGTLLLANSAGLSPPSTIDVGRIESLLGRASIRVGTNFTAGNFALQPFVTASVFHEFGADVVTQATTNFAAAAFTPGNVFQLVPNISSTLTSSRVGTYGQFALGIAGQLLNTGWLGYVRGDFRTGENIEGFSVNGGIRYQFTPEQLAAAVPGLITKGPRPAPVPVAYNWTGFYVGGYAGTTWGSVDPWHFVGGPSIEPGFAGFLGGGQVGFNYQLGSAVLGIEGDFGGSNAKGSRSCPNQFFFTCEDELHWLGSITGRLGLAVDRTLFYVKAGWAVGEVRIQTAFNPSNNPLILNLDQVVLFGAPFLVFTNTTPILGTTKTASGPTAGGGIEFGLTPNWSAKAEYMFYQLDKERFTVDNNLQVDAQEKGHLVRVGVNYHFNPTIAPLK